MQLCMNPKFFTPFQCPNQIMIPSSSSDGMDSNQMELNSHASRHAQKYKERLEVERQLAEQVEADATLARELQEVCIVKARS